MKMGFNGATSMKYDLFSDVESAAQAGFEYLEISKTKLLEALKTVNGAESIKKAFETNKIKPAALNSLEQATFFRDRTQKLEECSLLCEKARKVGVGTLIVVPGFLDSPEDEESIIKESVEVLKQMSKIAADYGVKLAFEFLGFRNCSVNKLGIAHRIVQAVNASNLGLVIDTFHFFVGKSTFEELKKVPVELIHVVHINDVPDISGREPQDSDRIMPGDGVLPLDDFFSVLKTKNYDGLVSIELFNPEYWEWDPVKLAQLAMKKMRKFVV